jgi:hypothetical protein
VKPGLGALLGLALLLAAPGCGYRVVRPDVGGGRAVEVPTTRNDTIWYGLEVGMSSALRADLQRQLDLRLVEAGGAFVLETTMSEVGRRARVALRSGGAAVGTAELELEWRLRRADGEVLGEGRIRRSLEFLTALDETIDSSFTQIQAEMAEEVALEVGASLAGLPADDTP